MRILARLAPWMALTVCSLAFPLAAGAGTTTTLTDSSYTVGSFSGPQINSFQVSGPGTVDVQLTDIPWPQSLSGVSFELVDASGNVLQKLNGFQEASISILAPGTYYALSYGIAAALPNASVGFGSYGLDMTFTSALTPGSPVPLPQSALLLASGLGLLAALRRQPAAITM